MKTNRLKQGGASKMKRRQSTASGYVGDLGNVVSRLTRALARGLLVMVLVATPSAILPGTGQDTQQVVALLALFAGALVFMEYNSTYPSLLEFRDAPPYNRIRFVTLFVIVLLLSLIAAAPLAPSALARLVEALGQHLGQVLDLPYSPVQILTNTLTPRASDADVATLRAMGATAYVISWLALAVYIVIFKLRRWPDSQHGFNVWTNLPTFEPTAGGDVVARLIRDARINFVLGFFLPFLLPTLYLLVTAGGSDTIAITTPQTVIWLVAIWAYYPATLLMRAIAMVKIADMIRRRRQAQQSAQAVGEPALA